MEYPCRRKNFFCEEKTDDGKIEGEKIEIGSEHYVRARTIAEMFVNYLEHLVIQQDSIRSADLDVWRDFVARMIDTSPLMRRVIQDNEGFYSRDLMRIYEKYRQH